MAVRQAHSRAGKRQTAFRLVVKNHFRNRTAGNKTATVRRWRWFGTRHEGDPWKIVDAPWRSTGILDHRAHAVSHRRMSGL